MGVLKTFQLSLKSLTVALLVSWLPFAQTIAASHSETEAYSVRPDIQSVTARAHRLSPDWPVLREAHTSAVALLLELYPAHEIYFLARDSELLFDTAILATEGRPTESSRLHLLNVSRANKDDSQLKSYLEQEGISEHSLQQGRKVIFVDTGFLGTLPKAMAALFSEKARAQLQTHLILSYNGQYPSLRSFMIHLNPDTNKKSSQQMQGSIISYEYMPRFTARSDSFAKINGRYQAVSPVVAENSNAMISKEKALLYMEDLKANFDIKKMQTERARVQQFLRLLQNPQQIDLVRSSLAQDTTGKTEALVRDLLESRLNTSVDFAVSKEQLGLIEPQAHSGFKFGVSPKELIKKYPQWTTLIENPGKEIPELLRKQDYHTLGLLIDASLGFQVTDVLRKTLFAYAASGILKGLQLHFVAQAPESALSGLALTYLSKTPFLEQADLIEALIQRNEKMSMRAVAQVILPVLKSPQKEALTKIFLSKADSETRDLYYQKQPSIISCQHVF